MSDAPAGKSENDTTAKPDTDPAVQIATMRSPALFSDVQHVHINPLFTRLAFGEQGNLEAANYFAAIALPTLQAVSFARLILNLAEKYAPEAIKEYERLTDVEDMIG